MRAVFLAALALAIACASSTSPNRDPLTGHWMAAGGIGRGVQEFQLSLVQANDTITGDALLTFSSGRPDLAFQVRGRTGLNGSPCFPPSLPVCRRLFAFAAMYGDVAGTLGTPYQSIDGWPLEFDRFFPPEPNER
jgi:hypothetical protein